MAVTLDTESAQTTRKTYRHRAIGDPTVEVVLTIDQSPNIAGMRIQISGAAGAAQLVQVLNIIGNKIKADFGV